MSLQFSKNAGVLIAAPDGRLDTSNAPETENAIVQHIDNGDHWVVVYGYSDDGIFVLDSSRNRFLNQWGYGEFIKRWDENWIAVVKEK